MDTSNLKKADKEWVDQIETAATSLANSGKPSRIVGIIRKLPISAIDAKHFEDHKAEFIWKSEPVSGVREDINGLYAGMWLTDAYDHIPMVFVSAEVLHSLLYPKLFVNKPQ